MAAGVLAKQALNTGPARNRANIPTAPAHAALPKPSAASARSRSVATAAFTTTKVMFTLSVLKTR